jgi:hypothetical protein
MKDEHIKYLVLRIKSLTDYIQKLEDKIKQLESNQPDGKLLQ